MSKSQKNTASVQREVLQAAKAKFAYKQEQGKLHRVSSIAFYEQGQWWFSIVDSDHNTEETYSVIDVGTGLDFELVKRLPLNNK